MSLPVLCPVFNEFCNTIRARFWNPAGRVYLIVELPSRAWNQKNYCETLLKLFFSKIGPRRRKEKNSLKRYFSFSYCSEISRTLKLLSCVSLHFSFYIAQHFACFRRSSSRFLQKAISLQRLPSALETSINYINIFEFERWSKMFENENNKACFA